MSAATVADPVAAAGAFGGAFALTFVRFGDPRCHQSMVPVIVVVVVVGQQQQHRSIIIVNLT